MIMHAYINRKFFPEDKAGINIFDHGLLYGDGVFETLRMYKGLVFKIDEHIDRLFHSAELINMDIPLKKSELKNAIYLTAKKNKLKDAYIRLTITRGIGKIGYNAKCIPNVIIIANDFIPYDSSIYEKGVSTVTYNAERFLPNAKSTNCLPLVLAKEYASKKNCFEAVLIDSKNCATEGTASNIFFVKKNVLYTPKENMLHGITRDIVVKIARLIAGIRDIKETKIKKKDIYFFDECFLTNTAAEIVPVVKIDNKKINNGFPGEITKKLMKEFKEEIKNYNAKRN